MPHENLLHPSPDQPLLDKLRRYPLKSHKLTKGFAFWLTGQSAAGKTTLAVEIHRYLDALDLPVVRLDGDELRQVFSKTIGNDAESRAARAAEYADLSRVLSNNRVIVILACIAAKVKIRADARAAHNPDQFAFAWVKTPTKVCIQRDPKGLYKKALEKIARNENADMVGVDIEYEEPTDAELIFDTINDSFETCCRNTIQFLVDAGIVEVSDADASNKAE